MIEANKMLVGNILSLAAFGVLAVAAPAPLDARSNHPIGNVRIATPQAISAPSPDLPVANTLPLIRQGGTHSAAKINTLHRASLAAAGKLPAKGYAPILPVDGGADYVVPVTLGQQRLNLIVDTGSSDTWAPVANYTCINLFSYMPTRQAICDFGPTWNIGLSSTWKRVAGQRLDVTYGDGTFARGAIVQETVTVGQIAVVGQEVGAVNYTGWRGNGGDSGLMGMAFEALDNAYPIGAPTVDANRIRYDPIFRSMYRSGQVAPVFAIKIGRNETGSLSLGGVPNDVTTTTPYATADFEYTVVDGISNSSFSFYTVNMTATYGPGAGAANATSGNQTTGAVFPGIVDSGTTGVYLPTADAEAFNALWSPPAKGDFTGATWTVECGATPPALALTIGGRAFPCKASDLIYYNGDGTCASVVFAVGTGVPKIIGDAWLRSVMVVHDVGASQLRIAGTD